MNIIKIDPDNPDKKNLKEAGTLIKQGGIVIHPTETLYGLGGDPFNEKAIEKINLIKRREKGKPFNYIISNTDILQPVSGELPALFFMLKEKFWPGPLTLIIKKISVPGKEKILHNAGIRIPSHPIARMLAEFSGGILISTSANIASEKETRSIAEIPEGMKKQANVIIDCGKIVSSSASTILDLTAEEPILIREGEIKRKDIEELIGPLK